jgi:REP element-mobilizing transposase RayT
MNNGRMPKPRKRQISLDDTPYYHCIARCVRRAYLCGEDPVTGHNFEHRRQWIVDRMHLLASVFAINLCAYAVMSNHYHLVIKIDTDRAAAWGKREVARRWLRLFRGNDMVKRWLNHQTLHPSELDRVHADLNQWQDRLGDVSWFMRCLNEPLARMANAEDACSGRFWEGRFKSQALLDERAVLACMAYVDLNPVRAAISQSPETSNFTSVQERVQHPGQHNLQPMGGSDDALPFTLKDYLEFVDWAGRGIRMDKAGSIAPDMPPILQRMNLTAAPVMDYLGRKEKVRFHPLGPASALKAMARSMGAKFLWGMRWGQKVCPEVVSH